MCCLFKKSSDKSAHVAQNKYPLMFFLLLALSKGKFSKADDGKREWKWSLFRYLFVRSAILEFYFRSIRTRSLAKTSNRALLFYCIPLKARDIFRFSFGDFHDAKSFWCVTSAISNEILQNSDAFNCDVKAVITFFTLRISLWRLRGPFSQ